MSDIHIYLERTHPIKVITLEPTGARGPVGPQGPAGPAGPNSVTSATTSDGTAELSLLSATIGNLALGGVIFLNNNGSAVFTSTVSALNFYVYANGVISLASTNTNGVININGEAATADRSVAFPDASGTVALFDGSGNFTVDGILYADHIHGNLAGSVYAHVRAGEALLKGDPVYISGSHGTAPNLIPIVSKADASNAAKMPAIGIMDAALANNANGHMVITGTIADVNTAAYAVNDTLYVASGGGLTATPPAANSQPVARVERSNTNNGALIVKVNGLASSGGNGASDANKLVRFNSAGDIPVASIGGLGTGVGTALGINVGSSGAFVVNGGALGTPSSGTLTNATGLPISTGVSGLGSGVAAFLATPTSANLAAALTDETGTGANVFANSPTLTNPTVTNPSVNTRAALISGSATSIALLQIQGTSTNSYSSMSFLDSGGTQRGSFGFGGSTVAFGYASTVYFEAGSGIPVAFGAGGSERIRILSTGEVGIGTSSPSTKAVLDLTSTTKGFLPRA